MLQRRKEVAIPVQKGAVNGEWMDWASRPHPYVALYHPDEDNHCPGCNGRNWQVGRSSAECAFCATAIPLAVISQQSMMPMIVTRSRRKHEVYCDEY